jgi:glutathione S-transferase
VRNLKALDELIGKEGFACGGRITLADCALVPGLFFVEMSCRPPASTRRFRQLRMSLPIGP